MWDSVGDGLVQAGFRVATDAGDFAAGDFVSVAGYAAVGGDAYEPGAGKPH